MSNTWKRGGHKERLVLRYFEEHDHGTAEQIRDFIRTIPTWGGGRRSRIPSGECIKRVMALNGYIRKYEPKDLMTQRGGPYYKVVVYYKPTEDGVAGDTG